MSEQNKRAIIIGSAFPLRGGIANFNEALCRSLNQAGVSTKIISFSLQYPSILFPGKSQYEKGNPPDDIIIETKINSINPFNWRKIAKQTINERPDFIIFRYWLPFMAPCLGTIAKIVRKKSDIKIIAITDNVIPHEKRLGDNFFTRYFIEQCQGFIAMSASVLEDLKKFTDTKHKLFLPHPLYDIFGEKVEKSFALKYLQLNPVDKHILFFGFIRKYKGLDLLLQAMNDERIKKLKIKLMVAGEFYENQSEYLKIIADNNLSDSIILKTNYIPSEEVKYYFSAADIVVQPYRSATQSGVTQIAYHFEKPMLVTNVGGLPEIVPHQKVGYVTVIDATQIANSIIDFYENNRANEFEVNIKEEKKRFLWSTFVEGLLQLVSKI